MSTPCSEAPIRVLIIGMADSVHIARWIRQFNSENVSFTLFPSGPHRRIHSLILEMEEVSRGSFVTVSPRFLRRMAIFPYVLDRVLGNRIRGNLLRRELRKNRFDLLHIQELQHAGYLAIVGIPNDITTPVLVSNWGSDIFWFGRFKKHQKKIKEVLSLATHYSAECHRDVAIAEQSGFSGRAFVPSPNAGGVKIESTEVPGERPSQRQIILIKGYTGFVGRAITALRAIRDSRDYLSNFEVVVYSASRKARVYAWYLRVVHQIHIRSLKPGLSHSEMLSLFRRSRVYIGISLSDGISTSLLEAMSQGCFPIQTDTSCANEWLSDTSGYRPSATDIGEIAAMLKIALTDDNLVDRAAIENVRTIYLRARSEVLTEQAQRMYAEVVNA